MEIEDMDKALTSTQGDPMKDDTGVYVETLNLNPYKFMDDAYYGEAGFKDGTYLTPHMREMQYTSRRQLSTYKNFVKPILDAMIDPVFADTIPRNIDQGSLFANFIKDTDNNGTTLDQAVSEIVHMVVRHGQAFVIMDNFTKDDMPETLVEARKGRVFPYLLVKSALDVDSSKLDKWGNIQSITFTDVKATVDKKEVQLYRTWTAQYSQVVTKSGQTYAPYAPPVMHGLGILPVIPVYKNPRRDKTKLCVSPPHYDIARICLAIYNKESEVRDLERAQSFSMLCVQTDRGGNLTIGSRNVLFMPMDCTIPPMFISPNPSILVGLMVNAEKMRDDMYKLAEQSGVTAVKSEASGVAEAYKFYGHETVLQKMSGLAKAVDYAIFDLFCMYTDETPLYEADYPVDFAPGNISVEVDTLDKYLKQDLPPKAKSLALQKWTRLILSDQDPDELEEAIEEIEATAEEEEPEAYTIEPAGETGMVEDPEEPETGSIGETGMIEE